MKDGAIFIEEVAPVRADRAAVVQIHLARLERYCGQLQFLSLVKKLYFLILVGKDPTFDRYRSAFGIMTRPRLTQKRKKTGSRETLKTTIFALSNNPIAMSTLYSVHVVYK